jgi:pimeloyl-ACP methyl ester carboxylesterase
VYWFTATGASAARLYWEHRQSLAADPDPGFVDIPTGVARYPKEVLRFPRSWVERHYNVTRWVDMPRGGHFAAMEQPELFAADVRSYFESEWGNR